MTENEIGKLVVDQCVKLHKDLGPGLLESVYLRALSHRFSCCGLEVNIEKPIPILLDGIELGEAFRADIILNDKVLIELKSQETLLPVHKKQVLTYLKLSGIKLGFLINFGEPLMKQGIHRLINGTL